MVVVLTVAGGATDALAGKCKMDQVGTLPIIMRGNQPLLEGSINGQPVKFLLDTGAFSAVLFRDAAERLNLPQKGITGLRSYGVGGDAHVSVATVRTLTLDHIVVNGMEFSVVSTTSSGTSDVVGVLGEDFFSHYDVDFDLAHSKITFYESHDCDGTDQVLWDGAYSVADFRPVSMSNSKINMDIQINGQTVRAILDSGAYFSLVETAEAARLGVTPTSPGSVALGTLNGIGEGRENVWIGNFDNVVIGDETIKHTKLRFGDMFKHATSTEVGSHIAAKIDETEMLLGADFLRAHRVLISHSQSKIYFSYIGGPIFQTVRAASPAAAAATPPAATAPATSPDNPGGKDGGPTP